jgi:uncharacterized membrane protein
MPMNLSSLSDAQLDELKSRQMVKVTRWRKWTTRLFIVICVIGGVTGYVVALDLVAANVLTLVLALFGIGDVVTMILWVKAMYLYNRYHSEYMRPDRRGP